MPGVSWLYGSSFTVSKANYRTCRFFPPLCMLALQWLLNLFLLVSIHRLIKMKDWTEILRKALVLSLNTLIFILATALSARKQPSDLCMCLDLGKGRKWIYWVQNMNSPPKILSLSSAQAASAGLVHVNKEKKEWQHTALESGQTPD